MYSTRQTQGITRSRAAHVRHACNLRGTRVRFGCNTRAIWVLHACDLRATRVRRDTRVRAEM